MRGGGRRGRRPFLSRPWSDGGARSQARSAGGDHRAPLRPRRGADEDRRRPRQGVEADVRRLPEKRAAAAGEDFVPFDSDADYNEYVDGKPRYDGVRSFLESRRIELPEGSPDDPPEAETVCGLGNRKNKLVLELIERDGVEPYAGSVAFVKAARAAGLRRAVVSSSANCQEVLEAAGIEDLFEARIDGNVTDEKHLKGKPAPDTYLAGAEALGVEPAAACVFEDAVSGVEAGARRELRPRGRRRPRPPRRGPPRARRRRRRRRPRRTDPRRRRSRRRLTGRRVIEDPAYTVEPWGIRETHLDLDRLAQSESVFALSNGHIGVRGTLDEGEPSALPGTYLNAFWEARPLPYAEAGYGYPEAGETVVNMTNGKIIRLLVDDSPFDIRYGELHEHERRLDFRSGILRRDGALALADREDGAGHLRTARLLRPAGDHGDPLHGRADRRADPRRRPVGAGHQRAATRRSPRTRAPRQPSKRRSNRRNSSATTRAPCSSTRPKSRGCGPAAAMGHEIDGPEDADWHSAEAWEDLGRLTVNATPGPGDPLTITKFVAYGWSARRSVPAVRDQVERGARRGDPHRLGRAGRRPARLPRRLLGARRRRTRRRRRTTAGGPLRPLPRPAGERPRRGPGDPGEGADRPRLRRPHLLGHRGLRPAAALLRGAGRRRRGAEMAAGDDREGARTGQGALPRGRRLPLADDQRRRVRRLLAGRDRRLPHQRRYRPGGLPLLRRQRRPRLRARRRPAAAGRNGAAVALARPPRRATAPSGSTA